MKLTNAICIGAILLLVGCATVGNSSLRNETVESIDDTLVVGQTMEQVRTALGDPMMNSRSSDGVRIWIYSFSEAQISATTFIPVVGLLDSNVSTSAKVLQITFDEDGLVADFTMTESDMDVDTSILN